MDQQYLRPLQSRPDLSSFKTDFKLRVQQNILSTFTMGKLAKINLISITYFKIWQQNA